MRSSCCRLLTLTTNNAESLNNRLKDERVLPVMELLLAIEEKVVLDRFDSLQNATKWRDDIQVTKYLHKEFNKFALEFPFMTHVQTGYFHFIVKYNPKKDSGKHGGQFTVTTDPVSFGSCSCGETMSSGFPCLHLLFIIKKIGLQVADYCHPTWRKDLYFEAYTMPLEYDKTVTLIDNLSPGDTKVPSVYKKRGRPRTKRIESQAATMAITKPKRQYMCSNCNMMGHSSRFCKAKTSHEVEMQ
jgi:hypothetical protein